MNLRFNNFIHNSSHVVAGLGAETGGPVPCADGVGATGNTPAGLPAIDPNCACLPVNCGASWNTSAYGLGGMGLVTLGYVLATEYRPIRQKLLHQLSMLLLVL